MSFVSLLITRDPELTFVRSPSLQFLSPHTAVELLSEEVEECHHGHIEKKEARQTNRAEEAE